MAEGSVQVELSIDEQKALRALTALTKKIDDFGNDAAKAIKKSDLAFASFAGNLAANVATKGIDLIGSAFSSMTGFVKDSVKEAANAESELNRLNVALAQTGIYTEQTSKRFETLSDEIENTTAFSGGAVQEATALIQTLARLSEDGLEKATIAATNLAATFNMDLNRASMILGKAAEGNVAALGKLGLEFNKGSTDAETFANVLETVEKRFGGAAQAQARTFAGAVSQLGNIFDKLKESVGNVIVQNPAVIAAFTTLKSAMGKVSESVKDLFGSGGSEVVANFFRLMLDGSAAVLLTMDAVGRIFSVVADTVMASIRIMALGIVTPIAGILELTASIPVIGEKFKGAADVATAEMERLSGAFDKNIQGMSDAFSGDTALSKMSDQIAEARGEFDVFYEDVKNKGPSLKNNLAPDNAAIDPELLQKQKEFNAASLDLDNQLILAKNELEFNDDLMRQERFLSRNEEQIAQITSFELTKSELVYQAALNSNELLKTAEETALANRKAAQEKELRDLNIRQKGKADIQKKEMADQQAFFSAATSLASSSNKELAMIGKAAALTQLAIQTPEAVASSFRFGSATGGPVLGFALGAIAATAMAAQAARIAGVKFADGGIVGGSSFSGDKVAANVNSGEMILNRSQQKTLFDIANGGGNGGIMAAIESLGNKIQNMTIVVQADGREIARLVRDQRLTGFAV
jgi:hypothetical protein